MRKKGRYGGLLDYFKSGGEIWLVEDGRIVDRIKIEGNTFLHGFGQYLLHMLGDFASAEAGTGFSLPYDIVKNGDFETGSTDPWYLVTGNGGVGRPGYGTCGDAYVLHQDNSPFTKHRQDLENWIVDTAILTTSFWVERNRVNYRVYYTDGTYTSGYLSTSNFGGCVKSSITLSDGKTFDYVTLDSGSSANWNECGQFIIRLTALGADTALDGTPSVSGMNMIGLMCEAGSDTSTTTTRDMTDVVSPFAPPITTSDIRAGISGDSNTSQNTITWTANFPAGSFDGTQTVGEFVFKGRYITNTSSYYGRYSSHFFIASPTGLIRISSADGDFTAFTPLSTQAVTVNYSLQL